MKAHIIKIGNSQGLRIPKAVLEQCSLENEVELEVRNTELIVRGVGRPRVGWENSFRTMADKKDDQLLDKAIPTHWDKTEWQW